MTVVLALMMVAANAAEPHAVQNVVAKESAPAYQILDDRGVAQLFVNASTGAKDLALSILILAPGASVAEHIHEQSSETLYIERGAVEMTIAGKTLRAKAGDAVYIPVGAMHSARALGTAESVQAVQIYVGPGPEQRFTKGKLVQNEK